MIPYDVILLFIFLSGATESSIKIGAAWLRLPKFYRGLQAFGYVDQITRAFDCLNPFVMNISKLLLLCTMLSHFLGCLFYGIAYLTSASLDECRSSGRSLSKFDFDVSNVESFHNHTILERSLSIAGNVNYRCVWNHTWIGDQMAKGAFGSKSDPGSISQQWLRAIYWGFMTILTIGFGDVSPTTLIETAFVFGCMFFAMTIRASLVSSIGNLVARDDTPAAKHMHLTDEIEIFMDFSNISEEIRKDVRGYIDYIFRRGQGFHKEDIIKDLPVTLRTELQHAEAFVVLRNNPIFSFARSDDKALEILHHLSLKISTLSLETGDAIVRKGEDMDTIYFLASRMDNIFVIKEDGGAEVTTVEWFGSELILKFCESVLKGDKDSSFPEIMPKWKETIVAAGSAEIFIITYKDFQQVLHNRRIFLSQLSGEVIEFKENSSNEKPSVLHMIRQLSRARTFSSSPLSLQSKSAQVMPDNSTKVMPDDNANMETKSNGSRLDQSNDKSENGWNANFGLVHFVPNSKVRDYWDAFHVLLIGYCCISAPLRVAFVSDMDPDEAQLWIHSDLLLIVIFGCDMILRLRFFYHLSPRYEVIQDAKKIMHQYMKTKMFTDLLATIPFELFANAAGASVTVQASLQLSRLFRIASYSEYVTAIESTLHRFKIRIRVDAKRVMYCFVVYLFAVHWVACGWVFLDKFVHDQSAIDSSIYKTNVSTACGGGKNSMFNTTGFASKLVLGSAKDKSDVIASFSNAPSNPIESWSTKDSENIWMQLSYSENCGHNVYTLYVRALHFATSTISTVGYGDIVPYSTGETVLAIVSSVIGVIFFAASVASFMMFFKYEDITGETGIVLWCNGLEKFLKQRLQLEEELRKKITVHYETIWRKYGCFDVDRLLSDFSASLRMDLAMYLLGTFMKKAPTIRNQNDFFKKSLAQELHIFVCNGGTVIYREGHIGIHLYWICHGIVEVALSSSSVGSQKSRSRKSGILGAMVLREGDMFGAQDLKQDLDAAKEEKNEGEREDCEDVKLTSSQKARVRERATAGSFCELVYLEQDRYVELLELFGTN
eukprot:g623.t1